MKRIFLLCFLTIVLTGCTSEVNLNVTKDSIDETLKIYDTKNNVYDGSVIKESVSSDIHFLEHDYEHYDSKEFEEGDNVGKIYTFAADVDIWKNLTRLRTCYEGFNVEKSDEYIIMNTSNEYRCSYLFGANNATLNIVSDLKSNFNNADKVEGNKYTWYINEENYKNKPISISFDLKSESTKEDTLDEYEEEEKTNSKIMIIILSVLLGIVAVASVFIFIKVKNSNK